MSHLGRAAGKVIKRPAWAPPARERPVDALPIGSPTGKAASHILAAELLAELRAIRRTHTEGMARVAGLVTNDVLFVGSELMPARGYVTHEFHVAVGAVVVDNLGQSTMWVSAGGYGSTSGQAGPQITPVPAGAQRTVPLAARQFTIVGTAADLFALQVFTRGPAPTAGALGAVNGGGA